MGSAAALLAARVIYPEVGVLRFFPVLLILASAIKLAARKRV